MTTNERVKKQVQDLIRKAARSIAAAKRHMEEGDYDFASSRAYYAAFYAMEASLLTKNLVFAKHSGVISAFNEHFLRNDTFPKEFSKLITKLFRNRQIGDYEFDVSIEAPEAKEDVLSAERIVKAVEDHLKKVPYEG